MIMKMLDMFIYTNGGIFSLNNRYINLHLIISQFLVCASMGTIITETQVQIVVILNGNSDLLKLSSMIGLGFSLLVNAMMTKERIILVFRKYYLYISALSTCLLILINMIIVIDNFIIMRFIATSIIDNSLVLILGNVINDTINNKFSGTERTIYSSKKNCISILASFIGVIGAFFIKTDLNSLLIIEAFIYILMLLDDVFVFRKLRDQVFIKEES